MDNDDEQQPVKCRTAMLELSLTHDGMADFLKVPRTTIVRMCLNDEALPPKHHHKVAILLSLHRTYNTAKKPIMHLAVDFLGVLHRQGGRLWLDDATRLSGLSGPQLKNIENIEQWLAIVWEFPSDKYGRHPFVYLTAAGYKRLGVRMPAEAAWPPAKSNAMVIKGLDEAQQMLLVAFNSQVEYHLKIIDSIRSIQTAMVIGMTSVDEALELYDAAVGQLPNPTPLKAIKKDTNKNEN